MENKYTGYLVKSISEQIDRKQLIAAIFFGIGTQQIDEDRPTTSKWISHYNGDTFIWTFEEDRERPMLSCQVTLRYSVSHAPKPDLADVMVSNTAIFSAFPASITQDMITDDLLLTWQHSLFEGLQASELIRVMGSMAEIKKALLIRWALKTEFAKPTRKFAAALH
jgi:hypothetical protein